MWRLLPVERTAWTFIMQLKQYLRLLASLNIQFAYDPYRRKNQTARE